MGDWDDVDNTTSQVSNMKVKDSGADDWGWSGADNASSGTKTNGNANNGEGDEWNGSAGWGSESNNKSNDQWGGSPSKPRGGAGRGKCFKCNESGHMSRECPNAGSGGGGGRPPMKCFNCQEEGHGSRDCPQPRRNNGTKTCNNCKQEGHFSKDCTETRRIECRKCGKEGHMSRECTEGGTGGSGRVMKCYNCNEEGHGSRECTKPRKPRDFNANNNRNSSNNNSSNNDVGWGLDDNSSSTNNKSNNDTAWNNEGADTGDATDWGTDNTSSQKGGGGGWSSGGNTESRDRNNDKSGSGCRKCGKEGHFAKDCTEEVLGPDGKPRPPLYKPEELKEDDDSLFDNTISSGINFDRYDKIPVNVTGSNAPECITAFTDIIKSESLLSAIKKSNYLKPTPVQKYGIPIIHVGRDLMACAQTGSGKTAAFLLPVIQKMFDNSKELPELYGKSEQTPVCLIITPTRELAIQIHTEAFKYTRGTIINSQIIYGGTSTGHQMALLSRGTHILVATPGRLLDFVNKGKVNFSCLKYLVLDEADRMIDQGFIPDIRKMMADSSMPDKTNRQTLMFSATFPDEVQRLAAEFLSSDYLFLAVGMVGAANADVQQEILQVEKFQKRQKLQEILGDCEIKDRTMIFVEQKKTADFLASFLSQSNYKATSIHGDRFQRQREEALNDFKCGRMPILVATSVASRGLDIKDVRHVVNYDLPKEVDDYVHRIGRTGRVGNIGKATSFYDPATDKDLAKSLCKILTDAGQPVPEWLTSESVGAGGSYSGMGEFGGKDIRKNTNSYSNENKNDEWSNSNSTAAPSADDEDW